MLDYESRKLVHRKQWDRQRGTMANLVVIAKSTVHSQCCIDEAIYGKYERCFGLDRVPQRRGTCRTVTGKANPFRG